MRILVIGASGFLGSYLYYFCKQAEIDVVGTSTSLHKKFMQLDITKLESTMRVVEEVEPHCVINCAAITNVDQCERDPSRARAINAGGASHLVRACEAVSARLVHISTDSVFDGKTGLYSEASEPSPINVYAKTKLEGERLVSELSNSAIIRTNFFGLSPNGKHLLNWILSGLKQGREIVGFDDIYFNPLWVEDLSALLTELASASYRGIIHCVGDEVFSKYEFINQTALALGYNNMHLKKGISDQVPLLASRPKNTTLSNEKMHTLLKTKIRTLNEVFLDASFDIYRAQRPKET